MSRPAKITIDLNAIQTNCRLAQTLSPQSKTLAVVKADAYGHGGVEVAKFLEPQVEKLTVSCLEEALILRAHGVVKPILLLEGCFEAQELLEAANKQCEVVVHHAYQVQQLLKANLKQPIIVWLKVDTGMHRLGIMPDAVESTYAQLKGSDNVKAILLMTHFAHADEVNNVHTQSQISRFRNSIQALTTSEKLELSMANSAAILAWPHTRVDWNRPGIMLYGLSPFAQGNEQAANLIPAMTLESEVIGLRQISEGESVGYGCTWTAKRTSTIATIAMGYGDGYPRTAKSGTPVLINNQRVPLVGRVSMDLISVDVTDLSEVKIGDNAVLWGKELSANEVASWADTIGYELVTRMPRRLKRHYT